MLERRSALSEVLSPPGIRTAAQEPGVTLYERRPLAILQVSAFATTIDAAAEILAGAGLAMPAANRMSGDDTIGTRSIGPGVWQIVGSPEVVPGATALRDVLRDVATVVDLSHARTALRIAGPDAARTLAKHCPLDLDPRQFPTGSATNTRFGHLGVTLARVDDRPTFELLVFRGYAAFVAEMLCEAAMEFGLTIR